MGTKHDTEKGGKMPIKSRAHAYAAMTACMYMGTASRTLYSSRRTCYAACGNVTSSVTVSPSPLLYRGDPDDPPF